MSISFDHVQKAAAFAARAHQGQKRKDGETPYLSHVFRVCLILRDRFGFDDPRMLCAALLHDTLEDTTKDFDDLAKEFSSEVAEWVALLTKDSRLPEHDREDSYLRGLLSAPWQVKACKLADVYDNLTDSGSQPAQAQAKTLKKTKHYLDGLSQAPAEELKRPLELTWQVWRDRAGGG